jgi:4-amino-4-deoxy-L-arabinose transferase-like glycosyltransferase
MTATTAPAATDSPRPTPPGSRLSVSRLSRLARRAVRGPQTQPAWVRPGVLALLVVTAVLYLWDLSASGYGNSFYAAAVQAGTKSWKSFFFGSLDTSNFITVDKPPASLWVMELSGRIFGFSSWSLLAPQALEGVACVGLLYATVRRWAGPAAGLLAGALLALTPVAVLMFRFNNPDALLVLLCVAAAYAVTRALERGRTGWLLAAGTFLGLAFLTKMLQAFVVLPAFALVYLVAAPVSLRRRIAQLLAAGLAVLVSAGWWVLAVMATPASERPYVGGSTDNSILNLAFGYNGLGRLTGNETGGGGGRGGGPTFSGATGALRLFDAEMGGQISWLLPAALLLLVAGLWLTRRAPRTDRTRAALLLWGGWLLVAGGVFSYSSGVIHPYYTIQLAPAIAALVAIGGRELVRARRHLAARITMAGALALTCWWGVRLLDRDSSWHPGLRVAVVVVGVLGVIALLVADGSARWGRTAATALTSGAVVVALVAGVAAPAAWALATAGTAHTGSTPSSGPASAASAGGFGFGGGGGAPGAGRPPSGFSPPRGAAEGGFGGSGGFGPPSGSGTSSSGTSSSGTSRSGTSRSGSTGAGFSGAGPAGAAGAGGGGVSTSAALTRLLKATHTTWSAATLGSSTAATLELASGTAVMAIGGFTGSDPAPTLARFEQLVAAGKISYFIGSGGGGAGGFGGSGGSGSAIASWVEAHFHSITVGGETVYVLHAGAR